MPNGYNQYIGMRYVPIVDGTWSESKAYEPLVVVVYNGNSYISKTYVPAGTLPTNETYWILAANYNAQVEQYRQEVRQYQQTVDNFDGDITDLEADITRIDGSIGNINTTLGNVDGRLNSLEEFESNTFEGVDPDKRQALSTGLRSYTPTHNGFLVLAATVDSGISAPAIIEILQGNRVIASSIGGLTATMPFTANAILKAGVTYTFTISRCTPIYFDYYNAGV